MSPAINYLAPPEVTQRIICNVGNKIAQECEPHDGKNIEVAQRRPECTGGSDSRALDEHEHEHKRISVRDCPLHYCVKTSRFHSLILLLNPSLFEYTISNESLCRTPSFLERTAQKVALFGHSYYSFELGHPDRRRALLIARRELG